MMKNSTTFYLLGSFVDQMKIKTILWRYEWKKKRKSNQVLAFFPFPIFPLIFRQMWSFAMNRLHISLFLNFAEKFTWSLYWCVFSNSTGVTVTLDTMKVIIVYKFSNTFDYIESDFFLKRIEEKREGKSPYGTHEFL